MLLFAVLVLSLLFPSVGFAEELEFVTYYPSPIANATEVETDLLSANRIAVGSGYIAPGSGALVPSDGQLIVEKRVGIGTDNPSTRLHVSGGDIKIENGTNITPNLWFDAPINADWRLRDNVGNLEIATNSPADQTVTITNGLAGGCVSG